MTISENQYDEFLVEALEIDRHIERMAAAINAVSTTHDIGVIINEWESWNPEATADTGLEQPGSVLNSLLAAAVLDTFNDNSDVVMMTNIAQSVNILQCLVETDENGAWARPTYRVFDLYAPHKGNEAVQTSVSAPTRELADDDENRELPLVVASASIGDGEAYVTLMNLDCREERTVEIAFEGERLTEGDVRAEILFAGQDPALEATADNANEFVTDELAVSVDDTSVVAELPPSRVAAVSIE